MGEPILFHLQIECVAKECDFQWTQSDGERDVKIIHPAVIIETCYELPNFNDLLFSVSKKYDFIHRMKDGFVPFSKYEIDRNQNVYLEFVNFIF